MKRRAALQLLSGLLLGSAAAPVLATGRSARAPTVGVVGAGIVGASIAMHLARAGARVTVFDRTGPAAGATRNSFAWVDPWTLDLHYQQLRLRSIASYRHLDRELGLGVTWGGYIDWGASEAEARDVRELAATLAHTPYAVRDLDAAAFRRLSPAIEPGPFAAAFYSPVDGHLDPVRVTERFLGSARRHGADVRHPVAVTGFEVAGDRITGVATAEGLAHFDHVILVAGTETPRLLAMLGETLVLAHAPGILAHAVPSRIVTRMVYDGPGGLEFKQMADGSIVGTDSEQVPDLPQHAEIREHPMDFPTEALRTQHGERILGKLARVMPAATGARLERLTLGFRVLPTDGLPIVGTLPSIANAHVVATHSGVTLAPILGRLVADEVLYGRLDPILASYRPERMLRPARTGA
jgi:glycine/D-amino acid oxidase-like deaminating enzyme